MLIVCSNVYYLLDKLRYVNTYVQYTGLGTIDRDWVLSFILAIKLDFRLRNLFIFGPMAGEVL